MLRLGVRLLPAGQLGKISKVHSECFMEVLVGEVLVKRAGSHPAVSAARAWSASRKNFVEVGKPCTGAEALGTGAAPGGG